MKLRFFFRQLKALISFRANCRVTSHLGCHLRKEELFGGKKLCYCVFLHLKVQIRRVNTTLAEKQSVRRL